MKSTSSTLPQDQFYLNYQSINSENKTNVYEPAIESIEADEFEYEAEDSPIPMSTNEIEVIKHCVVCDNAYRQDATCRVTNYCRSCGWASTTGQDLPHKIIPNAKCMVCLSKFATAWALECHQIRYRHLNEDACRHCGIPFKTKKEKKRHEYHCSKKKQNCSEASENYADNINAYAQRSFGCDFCSRKYHTELDLKRHQELLKHYDRPAFTCDNCHVVYYKSKRFKKHVCGKILTRQQQIKQKNIEGHVIYQRGQDTHYPISYIRKCTLMKVKNLQMKWRDLPNTSKFFEQLETAVRENDPWGRNQRDAINDKENHCTTPLENIPRAIKQENPEDLPNASSVIYDRQSDIVLPLQTTLQNVRDLPSTTRIFDELGPRETAARENIIYKVDNKENRGNPAPDIEEFDDVKIEPESPPGSPIEYKLRENFAGFLEPVDVNVKPSKKMKRAKANHLYGLRCDDCGKKFLAPKQLRQHKRQKHGPPMGPHECARCGELFRTKGLRKQHYKQRACNTTAPATTWQSVAAALVRALLPGQPQVPVAPDDIKWVPIQNTGHLGNRFLPTQHP